MEESRFLGVIHSLYPTALFRALHTDNAWAQQWHLRGSASNKHNSLNYMSLTKSEGHFHALQFPFETLLFLTGILELYFTEISLVPSTHTLHMLHTDTEYFHRCVQAIYTTLWFRFAAVSVYILHWTLNSHNLVVKPRPHFVTLSHSAQWLHCHQAHNLCTLSVLLM